MKIRRWLKLGAISSSLVLPLSVISATTNENETASDTTETEKEPVANFPETKEMQKNIFNEKLPLVLEEFIKKLELEVADYEKQNLAEPNIEHLKRITYYKKFVNYLKTQKDQIVSNPIENGFNIIFPNLLTNETYKLGDITYFKNDFGPVMIGEAAPDNYEKVSAIDTEGTVAIPEEAKLINNQLTQSAILNQINSYIESLSSSWRDILLEKEDFPKYAKDEEVFKVLDDNAKLDLNVPKGVDSWDAYFLSVLNKRTMKFDIEKNKEFNEVEEPTLPILPEEKIEEDPIVVSVAEENVPRLSPILTGDYINTSNSELISLVNSQNAKFNNEAVFFFNPLLKLLKYNVTGLREEGGKLIASITLTNTSDEKQTSYEREVTRYSDAQYAQSMQVVNNAIESSMLGYYDALGITKDLVFEKLGNRRLQEIVFDQIFVAVKIINNQQFSNIINDAVEYYKDVTFKNDKGDLINLSLSEDSKDAFTNSIHAQTIKGRTYFNLLTTAYKDLYSEFSKQISVPEIKSVIEANLNSFNFTFSDVNEALSTLRDLILDLDRIEQVSTFKNQQFQTFNVKLEQVQKQFINLGIVTQNKNITNESENIRAQYQKAYNELILKENLQSTKNTNIVLITIGTLITLLLIGTIIISTLNKKKANLK
ncbi:MSC_0620 family F1-like ATPase-associated subunit [Mycoplasma sp. 4463]|uniref:MSC_0620 family F1-like ATPase-associated subunit n=1 Tax=Mycoplasma sp. 4463 TaxID=3400998 RepID=UPI003AAAABC0